MEVYKIKIHRNCTADAKKKKKIDQFYMIMRVNEIKKSYPKNLSN